MSSSSSSSTARSRADELFSREQFQILEPLQAQARPKQQTNSTNTTNAQTHQNINLKQRHLDYENENVGYDHDSNKWHLAHYFNNQTRQFAPLLFASNKTQNGFASKWLTAPTFDELANDLKNLDDKQIEQMELLKQHQHNATTARQTNENDTQQKLLAKLIKSIQMKLVDHNHRNGQTSLAAASYDHLAQLSCDSGEMVIKLNFTEPFKGIVYPDHNRLSPCRFFGDGHHNYELRLPLRGCGTRQVAPRVFVNDVIVRFHKTLELEEDEVKTLICRYPPPLDITTSGGAGGQQVAAGNGLVHELDSRQHEQQSQHSNRPGESALQPNQFELLEPTLATSAGGGGGGGGGRPTNRFGNGASQLETNAFGELLAPPGGHQRQPIGDLINLTPAERILLRQHAKAGGLNDNLLMAPSVGGGGNGGAGGQQRTNSRLFNPEATSVLLDERGNLVRGGANSTGGATGANYFDRLTSVELLFLISSLMFLVLLALGLAGSYFCLSGRRDRRRRRQHQPAVFSPQTGGASAGDLLQRKRRHFSPTSASLYRGASGAHLAGAGSRYQSASGQLIARHHHHHPSHQQLYNPAAHRPAYYYQQYLAQAQAASNQPPSSPDDSDVSGQMLLPAGGSGGGAPSGGDTMTSRLASALSGSNSNATVGRRFNYPTPVHYHASTLRPSRSHHQLHTAGQQQQVVVGRRDLQTTNQRLATTSPQGQSQANQLHGNNTLGRRAGRPAAAQASFGSSREPLLKMVPPFHGPPPPVPSHAPARNPVAANQTLARMRHARSLQQLREEDNGDAGAQRDHFGAEHAFGANWLRQNQAQLIDGGGGGGGPLGGKPVERHCSVNARHGHQPHLNDHKIKLKQQQHHYDTSNLRTGPVAARPALVVQQEHATKLGAQSNVPRQQQQQVASIDYADDDDLGATSSSSSSSSDHSSTCSSEITVNEQVRPEMNNNNSNNLKSVRPKLILKSIEDSFVTNFTEIYEQEYKHLDTRRPLSMAEWRRTSETGRAAGSGRASPSSGDTSDDGRADEGEEATWTGTLKSSQTNLRSLTELDVNFAKSLLRPSLAASKQLADKGGGGAPSEDNDNQQRDEQLVRPDPQPPVDQQTSKPPNTNNNNNNQGEQENLAPRGAKAETPDLVISPEYNVGQRLRLATSSRKELRPTCGSPGGESRASHESISYV